MRCTWTCVYRKAPIAVGVANASPREVGENAQLQFSHGDSALAFSCAPCSEDLDHVIEYLHKSARLIRKTTIDCLCVTVH